jgi:signal transduction histidine kinase
MLDKSIDQILIVDDDPEIGLVIKQFLDDEEYSTTLVNSGSTALNLLSSNLKYTVILLDIKMADIDGVTVLKSLINAGYSASIIMMSGHGSEELAVECMKNGASDYISKPFIFDDLLQRIERARTHRWERIEKKRLQQEKDDFITMLSHDLKNPLTAVIGSIDIIREGCLGSVNEEQKDYLHSAIDSCNEVVAMIDNLLDIKKFEAGKYQLTTEDCAINELVKKIADQFARPARHYGIGLKINIEPGIYSTNININSFKRVLGNLLGNALKFTLEGGEITVSCRAVPGDKLQNSAIPYYLPIPSDFLKNECFARISVRDTGNGIAPDELESVFDRYTQFARRSDRDRPGAGLGLAYCKLAIEKFNGIIWAESRTKEWSEFIILLPCVSP